MGIYTILSVSLNFMLGYGGIISICHGAFFGIGAYAGALISLRLGLPFAIEILLASSIAGLCGLLIAAPTLRLEEDYMSLATYGFGVIVFTVLNNWHSLTRGPLGLPGIPRIHLFSFVFDQLWSYSCLVIFFVGITIVCLASWIRSPFGRVLIAIREDQIAVSAIGKNAAFFKLIATLVSAFFAGTAGVLLAHYLTFIDPSTFVIQESFVILGMVVFGGMGTIVGPIAGAVIMVLIPEVLRLIGLPSFYAAHLRQLIFCILIILIMLKRTEGLLGKSID
jgi:branched-chain amino acid transport system permease protein